MKSRSRKRGFTLVELLVVISIIALLLAIIVPSMNKARETAKRVICSNQLKEIARGIAMYADAWDQKMPFYGGYDPTYPGKYCKPDSWDEAHPYAVYRAIPDLWLVNGKPVAMKLGCLYEAGIITDPRVFYCPSNREEQYMFESYYNPKPWGTLFPNQEFNIRTGANPWVRVGYTYFPVDGTIPKENFEVSVSGLLAPKYTARRFDKLDPYIPYIADVLWFRKTMSHRTKDSLAINAAFKDTHVVYTNDWRLFTDNEKADTQQLWRQWDPDAPRFEGKVKFNFFYYNFFKKVQP